jgi:predicted RNase H-like HicB family nuclease
VANAYLECDLSEALLLGVPMRSYTAIIERDQDTGLFVGYVPGWPGAHSQGASLDELRENLLEVIEMLREDGEPALEATFVGTQTLDVA